MAPISDLIYFPSLEEALSDSRPLLSWNQISIALSDYSGKRQLCPILISFLGDRYVQKLLDDPSTVFAPPDDATRKDFETKTAPINVTSASTSQIDLNSIKQDAEWLSKNAKLNLVAALRVTVIELQSRPSRQLLGPLSSQDASNLQEAAGLENGQAASFLSELGAAVALDSDEIAAAFETTDARRRRIFSCFLLECRSFTMASDYFYSIKLYGRLPVFTRVSQSLSSLYKLEEPPSTDDQVSYLLSVHVKSLTRSMADIESGLGSWTDDSLLLTDDVEMDWLRSLLVEIIHTMSVYLQIVDTLSGDFAPSTAIGDWFSLMDAYRFFDSIQPIHPSIAESIMPLKTLAAAISIKLLSPAQSLIFLAEREEEAVHTDDSHDCYLLISDVLEQVHNAVVNAAAVDSESATPVIFAWTLLLHRMNVSYQNRTEKRDNLLQQNARENFESRNVMRSSSGRRNSAGSMYSIESSKFDGFLENATTSKDLLVVEQLAAGVTAQGRVFEVISSMASALGPSIVGSMTPLLSSRIRNVFLELLKVSYPIVGYQSEPVSCLLSVLAPGQGYWDLSLTSTLPASQNVVASMMDDEYAMEFYFQQALDRFPYEFSPFTTLCKTLCSASSAPDDEKPDMILDMLRNTPTITFTLPDTFQGYELVQEDENTNSFCLLEDFPLISVSSSWSRRCVEDDAYRLPAGSYGRFITDSGRVVLMEFPHSTLSLLGRQLEICLSKEIYRCVLGMLQPDEIAEAIGLLSSLLRSESLRSGASTGSSMVYKESHILQETSKHIGGGRDVITVVCELMDYYMQTELAMTEDVAVNILNAGMKFLDALLLVQPSRVWSYLARSELLSSDSQAGKLAKITGSLDLVSDRFDFLVSSLLFFSDLVDTAMSSAVQRRAGYNLAVMKQSAEVNPWLGTAETILMRVSLSVAQASVDVFESTSTWRFDSDANRAMVLGSVVPLLNKMIIYSYGTGEPPSSENLLPCLRPAASYIVDCFVSPTTGTLRYQPILTTFASAFLASGSTLYPTRSYTTRKQLHSVLYFSTTLLRVANFLDRPSTTLESYLFNSSTLLARLCAASDLAREPTLSLLQALVVNAGRSASEPPSLLGYLGPHISKSFLQLLSSLGKPFGLMQEVKTTWCFFSAVLRNRQQWMSNCLLTGQTPREAIKQDGKTSEFKPDSVFVDALGKLKHLTDLDRTEALAMLDFVASAQNYWPWTVFTLLRDTSYTDGLREYVRALKPSCLAAKSDGVGASIEARMAAYVAEILAMQLYHSRHHGAAESLAKELVPDLDYYLREGAEVSGYNQSLHKNFAKNFANKYYGCPLDGFRRTMLEPRELGGDYYYDVELADDMLGFDPGWLGKKGDGFKKEMELANANLSLVDAQIALFHAWGFLLVELSTCLPLDDTVVRQMVQVAQQCLKANQGLAGPESIFLKLVDARAKLVLVLIQRLVKSPIAVKEISQLLASLVAALNGVQEPFGKESIGYYRTLLKALFVTLRACPKADWTGETGPGCDGEASAWAVKVTQTVLNLLDHVVGHNFRTLVSLVHDKDEGVCPEDLGLLTAILQACLSLPNMEQSQTQVLNIMLAHDAMHAATSLFSWADQLAEQGDPVYGELSLLFLVELSTLPQVAEQLACDGILSSLLSANVTRYMLRTKLSPYGESTVAQRCYGIWVKGMLPLMLNLLAAVGPTLAPEISYVLQQFSHLLEASVDRFEAPGGSRTRSQPRAHYLTLLATSEVHSLALLTRVLGVMRANNSRDVAAVEWDATGLLENVEFWLSSERLLKEWLLPLGVRETEWRNTKGQGGGDVNLLEQKVVSQLETVRDVLSDELEA